MASYNHNKIFLVHKYKINYLFLSFNNISDELCIRGSYDTFQILFTRNLNANLQK